MKSVLVIGMGRFGRHLAVKMQELGNDVMIIDKNPEIVEMFSAKFTDAHIADCTNEGVIRSLGVKHFDLCFVTIGEDFQSSLVIASLLKKLSAKYVVAKANQDIQAELLKQIGADEIIYPEKEMAEKLAIRHNANNIFDYIPLTSDYSIYEIPVHKDWIGKSISAIDVRKKHEINIVAVKTGNSLSPMPGSDYEFVKDDHLIVIGKSSDVFKITSKS